MEVALLPSQIHVLGQHPLDSIKQLRRRGCHLLDLKLQPRPSSSSASRTVPPTPPMDWKKTLAEVKREFAARRFQTCLALCKKALECAGKDSNAELAYIIYLNFYAATALDVQARALHHTAGPLRAKLLLQAKEHYQNASKLVEADEAAMARPAHRLSPSTPSLHSPAGSTSSRSSGSTRASSPVSCMYSPQKPRPRRKKSVSFSDDVVEPIVRPDSPTLGFDDWLGRSSPSEPCSEPLMTLPATALSLRVATFGRAETILEEEEDEDEEEECHLHIDSFAVDRSVHRYIGVLSGLSRQIASHLDAVQAELDLLKKPIPPSESSDELRSLDLRARIERLRANGWQRRRFDPKRYEALCENAMAESFE
ncbi:hypothetical protein S40293_06733 [Stachybotrys chartarum IBT 40293]|nr:hypothetical protein S40293_06733 [Stachybotrys chartarum IBT 40293]